MMDSFSMNSVNSVEATTGLGGWPHPAVTTLADTSSEALDTGVLEELERLQSVYHSSFLPKLIKLFLEEAPSHLSALRTALQHYDAPSVGQAAHALKSGSYQLGAKPLAQLCEAMEQCAELGAMQQCQEMWARLETEFDRVRLALDVRLKASSL